MKLALYCKNRNIPGKGQGSNLISRLWLYKQKTQKFLNSSIFNLNLTQKYKFLTCLKHKIPGRNLVNAHHPDFQNWNLRLMTHGIETRIILYFLWEPVTIKVMLSRIEIRTLLYRLIEPVYILKEMLKFWSI